MMKASQVKDEERQLKTRWISQTIHCCKTFPAVWTSRLRALLIRRSQSKEKGMWNTKCYKFKNILKIRKHNTSHQTKRSNA